MKGDALGHVDDARADVIRASLPASAVGETVEIASRSGTILGTVQRVSGGVISIAPHGDVEGVRAGNAVRVSRRGSVAPLGTAALGRAIDARGRAIDGGAQIGARPQTIVVIRPTPAERTLPRAPLWTGIKAIDGLLTIARGGRMGIFGCAGAGKSSLLMMLEGGSLADVSVVALIGERGREAREWFARLHPRMTIVCAPSDRSAAERVAAGRIAVAQAGRLRALGLHVLLILDSFARLAAALREVAVACGEPTGRGGFPGSVFAELARAVEVAGETKTGSITLAATVLSEEGDARDPVAEAARSLLDGHISLSRSLAHAGRFPAIDVAMSVSRLMNVVIERQHANDAAVVRRAVCALKASEDARSLGIAQADPWVSAAQQNEATIEELLRQGAESVAAARTLHDLHAVAERLQP